MRTYHLLIPVGLALVVTPLAGYAFLSRAEPSRAEPGRLVADEPVVEWQSPPAGQIGRASSTASLRLTNAGGRPVRVMSIRSDCGCVDPKVEPTIVEPGAEAVVTVVVKPLDVGEKRVPIFLYTDSPTDPTVELFVDAIGGRKPPYLSRAGGDLTFLGDLARGDSREVLVTMTEMGGATRAPLIEVDLPFLSVEPMGIEEIGFEDSRVVRRDHKYRIVLDDPPTEPCSGTLLVTDPWDEGRSQRLLIDVRPRPPVQVFPKAPILRLRGPSDDQTKLTLTVVTRQPDPGLVVGPEPDAVVLLTVQRLDQGESNRASFELRPRAGASLQSGVVELIVHPSLPSIDPIPLSVIVRAEPGT